MCGRVTVKVAGQSWDIKPGGQIAYREGYPPSTRFATWGIQVGDRHYNHARSETWRKNWQARGWRPCRVPIAGFSEYNGNNVETDAEIAALRKGDRVVVMTREATAREQDQLEHHRVPVAVRDRKLSDAAWCP